jgi:uroporphyrin-III C-methyltransferase
MIYGRAQEEIAALTAAGVSYEIIPGVSAAFGASADLGVSLTKRGVSRSVVFVTPSFGNGEKPHEWVDAVIHADTAVLYMAARDSGKIARTLIDAGAPINLPVVVVENATLEHRQIIPTVLSDLPMAQDRLGEGPALILIGEVYEEFVQTALTSAPSAFGIALAV